MAFFLAARWFRRIADGVLVEVLEAGAIAFFVLLVSLEIRTLIGNEGIASMRYGLLERSLQSIAWLAISLGMFIAYQKDPRRTTYWAARLLGGGAVLHLVIFQALAGNPLFTGRYIGDLPIFNMLLLAYGVPALLALAYAYFARLFAVPRIAMIAGGLALFLFFVELSLEVRRAFHGPILSGGYTSDPEWYSYSAAWLIFAGLLLALGLLRGSVILRYCSLGLVFLVVAKVFLFDMSALRGLYRAASFIGLGLALVGIGFLYQRFVLSIPPPSADNQAQDAKQ
jgi:uncharacterized membrane protein